jgi:hypothetical protein
MQSPFWLVAHVLSQQKDGFSGYYQKAIDFAGSFYLTLGLFFLFFTIKRYRNTQISIALAILIVLSTGLFYYGVFETGMSHIYSFCCFAIILFLTLNQKRTDNQFLMLTAISSLFIVVRPINALFLIPILLFILISGKIKLWKDVTNFFTFKISLFVIVIVSVFLLPQLLYYKYAFGSIITNSYQNEPLFFPSLSRIIELLFSPNNGLFLYYPIILCLLIYAIFNKSNFNNLSFFLISIYILIYASWWSLSLGCSFGHRSINDFVIIFFIPIIISKNRIPKLFFLILGICTIINLKFIFSYDTCLYTSTNWNFAEYLSILFGDFK